MADIAKAIEPRSDQQNAVDYLSGPRVFTVAGTSDFRDDKGRAKVNVHLVEAPDRPFKPSATNLRLIVIGWGQDDTAWVGRRIKLDLDPEVRFGGEKVGGIRVTALSDLEQPYTVKLPTTRGKKAEFRVEKLDVPPAREMATEEKVAEVVERLHEKGLSPAWLNEQAGRNIAGPNDITADEAEAFLEELAK